MKILYISPRYTGGIGGNAFRVSEKLRQHDFDIKLMHIPHIPIKNVKNPSFVLFGAVKAALDREKYDIAHAWNVPSAVVLKFVKARKKVLSVHGVYSEQVDALHSGVTSSVVSATEEKLLKIADALTTDSKLVQKTYKERLGLDFVYLPGPLNTDEFKEIPDVEKKPNQVVYIGRDSPEKGADILKSIENKIHGKVVYCTNLPWKEAMMRLKESSVLVVPSRMESQPQVIKEAFYLKTPVVATSVGDIPNLVQNDVTGMLVEPNNPEQILKSINYILANKEKSERYCQAAYDFVMKNFTWDVLLQKYVDFYENLAKWN